MRFEWDENKNEENVRHHGIDFADVTVMFAYPMLTQLDERKDYGEDRWVSIGMLVDGIAVVVWTEREGDIVRIISARKVNKYERKSYEAYLTNRLGPFS